MIFKIISLDTFKRIRERGESSAYHSILFPILLFSPVIFNTILINDLAEGQGSGREAEKTISSSEISSD